MRGVGIETVNMSEGKRERRSAHPQRWKKNDTFRGRSDTGSVIVPQNLRGTRIIGNQARADIEGSRIQRVSLMQIVLMGIDGIEQRTASRLQAHPGDNLQKIPVCPLLVDMLKQRRIRSTLRKHTLRLILRQKV